MNFLIKIIYTVIIFKALLLSTFWYTANDCSSFWERICPSYIIWKVIDNPQETIIKEVWDDKNNTTNETKQITFAMERNRFFMFDNETKEYKLNDIILNRIQLHSDSRSYIPKKWDILLYERHWKLDITKENFEKIIFNSLDREESYVENGQNIMWKNEYNSIMFSYSGSFLLNDSLQNYNILYCENDIIKIKSHENTSFNTYLPFKKWQTPSKGTWDYSSWEKFLRDMFTNPKVEIEWYNQKNLENDLQYLAPCTNFNTIFWIEEEVLSEIENTIIKKDKTNIEENTEVTQSNKNTYLNIKLVIISIVLWIILLVLYKRERDT